MKKLIFIILSCIALIISGLTACGDSGSNTDESDPSENTPNNQGNNENDSIAEVWTSDEFLKKFSNFELEINFFTEWNKGIDSNDLENSTDKIINEKYLDCLWAVWKTYLLETEIGTEFEFCELEGIDVVYNVYLIPRIMVKNAILQLYDIEENEIKFEEWDNYNVVEHENPEYFKLLMAFGGRYVLTEILYDTMRYYPDENIVIFDVQYYMPETEKIPEFEMVKLRYKFQPFMYKDRLQQYKFISVERIL